MGESGTSSILAFLCAIGCIVGIFLLWIQVDLSIFGSINFTGWELVKDALNSGTFELSDGYYIWMPVVAIIFSVIGLVGTLFGGGGTTTISGLLVLGAVVAFALYSESLFGFKVFAMHEHLGIGAYITGISGFLMMMFGIGMSLSDED